MNHGPEAVDGLIFEYLYIYGYPKTPTSIQLDGFDLHHQSWDYTPDTQLLKIFIKVKAGKDFTLSITETI